MPAIRLVTINGRIQRLSDWARESGMTTGRLYARLKLGIAPEKAILPEDFRRSKENRLRLSQSRIGILNPYWKGGSTPESRANYCREWRKKNESYVRDREYQKRFGITLEEYEKMLIDQHGVCCLCGRECHRGRLAVDHCHTTGKIRGLLCRKCNIAIGLVNDDPEWMKKAEVYLANKK